MFNELQKHPIKMANFKITVSHWNNKSTNHWRILKDNIQTQTKYANSNNEPAKRQCPLT
jgi:hypothetical protein